MPNIENNLKFLFSQLKECHSRISPLYLKQEKCPPIRKLFEAFSLCSGAFYNLCAHNICYKDLDDNSKNEHDESWTIFGLNQDFQKFKTIVLPPSKIIQPDFRSMSIANAAFRLSAAGELVCDVIQKIDLNECEICKSGWPYQRFFDQDKKTWNRKLLHKQGKKCLEFSDKSNLFRNISLLIALRDEYGHSELNEGHECRTMIRKKYYGDYIIESEIEMLRSCVITIHFLCDSHPEKLTKS